eukprot:1159037-Pelagomonas_calceolata.AAC.2
MLATKQISQVQAQRPLAARGVAPLRPQRGKLHAQASLFRCACKSRAPTSTHLPVPPLVLAVVCKAQCSNKVAEIAKKATAAAVTLPALVQAHPAFALVRAATPASALQFTGA